MFKETEKTGKFKNNRHIMWMSVSVYSCALFIIRFIIRPKQWHFVHFSGAKNQKKNNRIEVYICPFELNALHGSYLNMFAVILIEIFIHFRRMYCMFEFLMLKSIAGKQRFNDTSYTQNLLSSEAKDRKTKWNRCKTRERKNWKKNRAKSLTFDKVW